MEDNNLNVSNETAVTEETKEKKPNALKRAANSIRNGLRKIKENPITCAVCAGIGAVATLAVKAYLSSKTETGIVEEEEHEEIENPYDETEETVDE